MTDFNDVIKSADATDKFLESSIKNHRRRLQEAIMTLEKNIINMTSEFKTTDGSLLGPRVNMKQAQKIHSQLTTLFDEAYGKETREVVKGFNQSANYIKKSFKDLDIAMDFTSVDKDMIKTLKKSTWGNFNQFGLQAQERLVDTMYNSILGKQPFSNLVDGISAVLTGFRDKRGRSMSTYVDLYANDAIMDFHNAVHIKKAEDLGFKYFLYYGNAMANTRDFCRERLMKVFSKEEIESWDFPWGGKSGPAMTNRGGYNCRHHWRPVRKNWIDEEAVLDKNQDKLKNFESDPNISPKIVSKTINELEFYHGTDEASSILKEGFEMVDDAANEFPGLSLTTDKKYALDYGDSLVKVKLDTKNVFRVDNDFWMGKSKTKYAKKVYKYLDDPTTATIGEINEAMAQAGYDGFAAFTKTEGKYHVSEVRIWSTESIKDISLGPPQLIKTAEKVAGELLTEKKLAEKVVKETKGNLPLMTSADKFKGCLT